MYTVSNCINKFEYFEFNPCLLHDVSCIHKSQIHGEDRKFLPARGERLRGLFNDLTEEDLEASPAGKSTWVTQNL